MKASETMPLVNTPEWPAFQARFASNSPKNNARMFMRVAAKAFAPYYLAVVETVSGKEVHRGGRGNKST